MKLKKQKHEQQKKNGNDLMSKGMDAHSKNSGALRLCNSCRTGLSSMLGTVVLQQLKSQSQLKTRQHTTKIFIKPPICNTLKYLHRSQTRSMGCI